MVRRHVDGYEPTLCPGPTMPGGCFGGVSHRTMNLHNALPFVLHPTPISELMRIMKAMDQTLFTKGFK